jgi:hypothetical protein
MHCFLLLIVLYCMNVLILLIHLISEHLGCLWLLALMNKVAMNIYVPAFSVTCFYLS